MSDIQFEFRPYARPFKQPLQTHHGEWAVRQGLILRLTDPAGKQGWGEIAPIAAFGSETWTEALHFCQSLPAQLPPLLIEQAIEQIPDALSACRFGLESAWEMLTAPVPPPPPELDKKPLGSTPQEPASSILLPTGTDALSAPPLFTTTPGTTFKWKIGVAPMQTDLATFEELIQLLPAQAKLRLDANGGLTWQQACQWLQLCDAYGVEFLEQPLPPDQIELMLKLSHRYTTPLALDESVTTLTQLKACYQQGWRAIFVIKAPLAGSPRQLWQFCQSHQLDLVWSSVFETAVARRYIVDFLMAALPPTRAPGFGVEQWFNDRWEQRSPEQIWQRLSPR